jgi:hypothetical protein
MKLFGYANFFDGGEGREERGERREERGKKVINLSL